MGKKSTPTIFWDFDGTLAYRPGLWGGALLQALDEHEPGHGVRIEQIRPLLQDTFPWHRPEHPHPELSTLQAWWATIEEVLARAYQGVGFDASRAVELAHFAHECFVDPRGYLLYEDTTVALNRLSEHGWNHMILSNHVPELPQIVSGLGLEGLIQHSISSAVIGYEKPHPEAFRIALALAGDPEEVWMVGDNFLADVNGAEAAGIPAVLVRSPRNKNARYYAGNLLEAAAIIESAPQSPQRPA